MGEDKSNEILKLEEKFDKGLWNYEDGERYGYLLTDNDVWLTPESFLSY